MSAAPPPRKPPPPPPNAATPLVLPTTSAAAPLVPEFVSERQRVDCIFTRLEADVSGAEVAAWRGELTQILARLQAHKQAQKKKQKGGAAGGQASAAAAALAQLGRDCGMLVACLAARDAQALDIIGAVQCIVSLLVAADRPGAPPFSKTHQWALLRSLRQCALPRQVMWLDEFLTGYGNTLPAPDAAVATRKAWLLDSAGATPLVECILAVAGMWQQLDLLPALERMAVRATAQFADIGATLANMTMFTETTIAIANSALGRIHAQQIQEQHTLTLLNKLHACWEAIWLLTWRLSPATLHRVCEGYDLNAERTEAAEPWPFVSAFSSRFNNLLSMQAPPAFHPPCCMLCRRVDSLSESTSHALSNCILNLYDVPGQHKQVVLDFNSVKPMTAAASKWKMCCKSCEGMFSAQGEDRLAPWLKQLYDPYGHRTLLERGITQDRGHVFSPPIGTNSASLAAVSPLFHAILGNIVRGLLFSGADSGEREEADSYLALLESLRQFFAGLVPDSQLLIDYSALHAITECDEHSFDETARDRVRVRPQLPALYCFASPLLLEALDAQKQAPMLNCGQTLSYQLVSGHSECVVHLRVWGLHFVCLRPSAASELLGDVPCAQLARHLVRPTDTQLYLWRGPPAVPPELPILLQKSVEQAYEEQRVSFHATSADDVHKKVTQAGLHMRDDVDAAIRASQQSSCSVSWARSFFNLPAYITMVGSAHEQATEFVFGSDKAGMLPLLPRRSIVCAERGAAFHFSLYFHPVAHPKLGTLVALLWETRFDSGADNIVSFMLHKSPLEAQPLGGLEHKHLPRIYTDSVLPVIAAMMHEASPQELCSAPVAFREAAAALPRSPSSLQQLCAHFWNGEHDWQRRSPVFVAMERRRTVPTRDGAEPPLRLPAAEELHLVSECLAEVCKTLFDTPGHLTRVTAAFSARVTRAGKLAETLLVQLTRIELVTDTSADEKLQTARMALVEAFTQLARFKGATDLGQRPVALATLNPALGPAAGADSDQGNSMLQRVAGLLLEAELKLRRLYSSLALSTSPGHTLLRDASALFQSTVGLHSDILKLEEMCRGLPASVRERASQCSLRWHRLLNAIDGFTEQLGAASGSEVGPPDPPPPPSPPVARRFVRGVRNQGNTCWLSSIFIALSVVLCITDQADAAAAPGLAFDQLRPDALMHTWRELLRTMTSPQPQAAEHAHTIRTLRQHLRDAQQPANAPVDLHLADCFNFESAAQEDVCEALLSFLHSQRPQPAGAFHATVISLAVANRCHTCGHAYQREEEAGTCVLPLALHSVVQVAAAAEPMSVTCLLQHYMREERAEGFRCPHCDADEMQRQCVLRAGPAVLCIQLLRFTRAVDNTPHKDVRPVRCDRLLTVQLTPGPAAAVVQCAYHLQACVLHHSNRRATDSAARPRLTPNSGHYTVLVLSEDQQRWELYNDDYLPRVITEDTRVAFNSASDGDPYLLIYKRISEFEH